VQRLAIPSEKENAEKRWTGPGKAPEPRKRTRNAIGRRTPRRQSRLTCHIEGADQFNVLIRTRAPPLNGGAPIRPWRLVMSQGITGRNGHWWTIPKKKTGQRCERENYAKTLKSITGLAQCERKPTRTTSGVFSRGFAVTGCQRLRKEMCDLDSGSRRTNHRQERNHFPLTSIKPATLLFAFINKPTPQHRTEHFRWSYPQQIPV